MDKQTIEKMKDLLLAQKREIMDTLIATNADFRAIVEEMDPPRISPTSPPTTSTGR